MTDDRMDLWSEYARVQERMRHTHPQELDSCEAQLDLILAKIETGGALTIADLARAKDTAERGARRRRSILLSYGTDGYHFDGFPDPEIGAGWSLALQKSVRLLSRTEIEFAFAEFSRPQVGSHPAPGAARVKLHRIRKKLRDVRHAQMA